jgi:hypothetical protein
MSPLESFSPPGNLNDLSAAGRAGWSARVAAMMDRGKLRQLPRFFNPLHDGEGADAVTQHAVTWPAFPATLSSQGGSVQDHWQEADGDRDTQDEYCEWGVERSGDEISRVTFTTETPDYFEQLLETDEEALLDLYEEFAGSRPQVADLVDANGRLNPRNGFNRAADGRIAHLSQGSNTLPAAVTLVAEATVPRESGGMLVTDQAALVECGRLGEPRRNSDPQISGAVNQLAVSGEEVSLADPPGLYIHEFIGSGIKTPDRADAAEFWEVTRGDAGHALRAKFEVPSDRGYGIGEIEIDGRPITTGAQLADRVRVTVVALARPSTSEAPPQPCVG